MWIVSVQVLQCSDTAKRAQYEYTISQTSKSVNKMALNDVYKTLSALEFLL